MKIGIISDTHGNLPAAVHELFAGVDHIIHAGDVGGQTILDELELIAPLTAVVGNCDYPSDYHNVHASAKLTLANARIYIAHTPTQISSALAGHSNIAPGEPLPQIVIHGHTHVVCDEIRGAVRWLCPGSPVRPRGGHPSTVMIMELQNNVLPQVEVIKLS